MVFKDSSRLKKEGHGIHEPNPHYHYVARTELKTHANTKEAQNQTNAITSLSVLRRCVLLRKNARGSPRQRLRLL